jgi:hypothetical protein
MKSSCYRGGLEGSKEGKANRTPILSILYSGPKVTYGRRPHATNRSYHGKHLQITRFAGSESHLTQRKHTVGRGRDPLNPRSTARF